MHRAQPFLSLLHRTYIHHARQAGWSTRKVGKCNAMPIVPWFSRGTGYLDRPTFEA